jgi:hypothetical protein
MLYFSLIFYLIELFPIYIFQMRVWVRNKEAGKVLMLFPLSFYTYLLCPLLMGTDIWQEIEVLNQEFVRLGISQGST